MSTIIATTLSNGSVSVPTATVVNGSAKAWVNFNGTGTVAIREAFNVASLTDNGTGDYTVNLTAALTDANYTVVGSCVGTTGAFNNVVLGVGVVNTTTATRVKTAQGWGGSAITNFDADVAHIVINR